MFSSTGQFIAMPHRLRSSERNAILNPHFTTQNVVGLIAHLAKKRQKAAKPAPRRVPGRPAPRQ
jgi:hypothetical protein